MLPDDIFLQTLNSLDLLRDVLSARLVNRQWARGAEETGLWITAWRQLRDSFAWHLRHCCLHVSFTASIADQRKLEFEMPFIEAGLERKFYDGGDSDLQFLQKAWVDASEKELVFTWKLLETRLKQHHLDAGDIDLRDRRVEEFYLFNERTGRKLILQSKADLVLPDNVPLMTSFPSLTWHDSKWSIGRNAVSRVLQYLNDDSVAGLQQPATNLAFVLRKVDPDTWGFYMFKGRIRYDADGRPSHYASVSHLPLRLQVGSILILLGEEPSRQPPSRAQHNRMRLDARSIKKWLAAGTCR